MEGLEPAECCSSCALYGTFSFPMGCWAFCHAAAFSWFQRFLWISGLKIWWNTMKDGEISASVVKMVRLGQHSLGAKVELCWNLCSRTVGNGPYNHAQDWTLQRAVTLRFMLAVQLYGPFLRSMVKCAAKTEPHIFTGSAHCGDASLVSWLDWLYNVIYIYISHNHQWISMIYLL